MKAICTASEETTVALHAVCSQASPAISPWAVGTDPVWGFSGQLEKLTEEKSSKDC